MANVRFDNAHAPFHQSLKRSVDAYFRERALRRTGDWRLFTKALVLLPLAPAIYLFLLFGKPPAAAGIAGCMLLGLVLASIGFNIMHDANHGAFSQKKWLNNLLGLSLNLIGGNAFFWKQKHNILHHTYTNVEGIDDDIAQTKLLRQSPSQEWRPVHRYQHRYLSLAYGLSLFSWIWVTDFLKYFRKRVNNNPLPPMSTKEHLVFWASKVFNIAVWIVIPIWVLGPLPWLTGLTVTFLTTGIVISWVFQLAHAVEGPEFNPAGLSGTNIEMEWAAHQVRTTANFATHNRVLSWYVGGLNFQVEHHLFPRIAHVHYPALSRIVRRECEKHGLPYHCFDTLGEAIRSHRRTMRELGRKPELEEERLERA
ncbi:acyl-CoA desaturase [Flaviaesturariibacter flavus]|uniref:Acyl-CoA desaturase n=1 Tax=Flaviaesturariibacter flavus TaxID=2502780 RepID=A0A4R1BKF2_9BACT|nr:acyl-CoA desaturase [Flaviaesturariibacter flavus]TCJ17789.1 acyl-CoA desaturase [Flaviaesturariibacter flavus]